jgi:signal transduction histidine kinase
MRLLVTSTDVLLPMIAGTVLILALIIFIGYFLFLHYKTRQKFEWERQKHKEVLLQTEIEIKEQTLDHISRELHDNLGQMASLIKINLNLISNRINDEAKEQLNECITLTKQLTSDIKSLSLSLNSEHFSRIGLHEALRNEMERINKLSGLKIVLHATGNLQSLQHEHEIVLFRMCQEILHNILKHAGASRASISLDYTSDFLLVSVEDDGCGFEVSPSLPEANFRPGSGLINLRKRSQLIGADLAIESEKGRGTRIRIKAPVITKV